MGLSSTVFSGSQNIKLCELKWRPIRRNRTICTEFSEVMSAGHGEHKEPLSPSSAILSSSLLSCNTRRTSSVNMVRFIPNAFNLWVVIYVALASTAYSPRWLMQKDRFDEAEKVLKRLHVKNGEQHHETAIKEFHQMKKQLEND